MTGKSLAFVGMPGSGKSTCVEHVQEQYDWPVVYFGGMVLEELHARGLELNETNERFVREDMREKEGKDVLAKRVGAKVLSLFNQEHKRVVIDGLYSWTELRTLRANYDIGMTVVAVVAPRDVRYKRLAIRPERPRQPDEAQQRDISEIENLEKGGPIAFADEYILNGANTSIKEVSRQVDKIISSLG